jgi:hypothetical protein
MYGAGFERQHITRWHDADGNATKTILHTELYEYWGLQPDASDARVILRSQFTKHYEYLEPGVRDSRVMRKSGAQFIVKSADGKILARETGWIEFAPGLEDEVWTDYRGHQDLIEGGFDAFASGVCATMTAG